MTWVESLYGVHVKFTVLEFILATFVQFWGSDVDITLGSILILAKSSSVSCGTVARVMSLLRHIASGSASIIRQGGQEDITLIIYANYVVWSRIEKAKVIELGDFDVFGLVFTTKLFVIFDWVCLFNVVNLNLWLHVRIHVWWIHLRRAISIFTIISCDNWRFLLLWLFSFIFLFYLGLNDTLCNNNLLLWLIFLIVNFFDFCIFGIVLIFRQILCIIFFINWRMVVFIIMVSFDWWMIIMI